jgi:hypothetical protein
LTFTGQGDSAGKPKGLHNPLDGRKVWAISTLKEMGTQARFIANQIQIRVTIGERIESLKRL